MKQIHPHLLPSQHPLRRGLRRAERHWPDVFSKLVCMDWWLTPLDGHVREGVDVPVAGTDGGNLYLNPAGLDLLIKQGEHDISDPHGYVAFALVHEGLHGTLNHVWRLEKLSDKDAANAAADYKVNELIYQRNKELGQDTFPIPPWAILDTGFSEPHSTEQLYQFLKKKHDEKNNSESPGDTGLSVGVGQGPNQESTEETGSPTQGPDNDTPDPGSSSEAQGTEGGGGDSEGQTQGRALEGGKSGESDVRGLPGSGAQDTFRPEVDPRNGETQEAADQRAESEEQKLNETITQQAALDHVACGTDPPSGTRIAVERDRVGCQDWVSLAMSFVDTRCRQGWMGAFNPQGYISTGLISPGRLGKKVGDIVVVVDSSSSIADCAWKKFLDFCQHTLDEVQPETMHILSVAHTVAEAAVLEVGDTVPDGMKGGGGTSFKAAFDWVKNNLIDEPVLLIYFTDGHCSDHHEMEEPCYPTLWLSYAAPQSNFPWGEYAYVTVK